MQKINLFYCILLIALVSCKQEAPKFTDESVITITGETQGTTYTILYYDTLNRNIKVAVDSILARIDSSLSTYKPNSIISKFNQSKDCAWIDSHFLELFFKSEEVCEATGGAFDPTVKSILNIWGFGSNPMDISEYKNSLPDNEIKDSLIYEYRKKIALKNRDLVGWDLLMLGGDILYNTVEEMNDEDYKDNFVCKDKPEVELTFDAIAQGYSVDVIAEYLFFKLGIKSFLIEVGGEIMAEGRKPSGKKWTVSIEHPDIENPDLDPQLAIVPMGNLRSLAVSGNYRNYLKSYNGKRYGHSIDPRTGISAENKMLSVAVFADECALADAYATAFMVMGVEEAVSFVEINPYIDLEVMFTYVNDSNQLEIYTSEGLKGSININR